MRFTRDRRRPLEQAKSGLRIAGALVASVIVVALFGLAYSRILDADQGRRSLTGWPLMIGLAIGLELTVQYWRSWFFCLPGYLGVRSSLWFLLGWFSPKGFIFIGFALLMLAMAATSFRFSQSATVHAFDRAILLVAAACLLASMLELFARGQSAMALLFAAVGDLVLFGSRFYPSARSRQRARHDSGPLTLNR
jgi:hypothetical protein